MARAAITRVTALLRLCAPLCFMLLVMQAVPALATPLPRPCLLGTEAKLDGATLIASPSRFDCARAQRDYPGPVTWGLFTGLNVETRVKDRPLLFRHSPHRFDDQAIWVRYGDGRVSALVSTVDLTGDRPATWMQSFVIPARAAPVTDILVRFSGLQHQRGVAPNAALMTRTAAAAQDDQVLAAFALCGGIMLTLIIYNLLLFAALRYRFILAYSVTALAALATVLVWSGAIYWLVPGLTTGTQISLILLGFAAYAAAVVWFLFDFIGETPVNRWLRPGLLVVVAAMILTSLMRFVDPSLWWREVDRIWYGALALLMVGILAYAGDAARRGSRPARIYLAIWLLPICAAALRLAWGLRLTDQGSVVAELSALFLMVFEAVMTALAVGWRIGEVKTERDEAHGREQALRALAEVDPLSGLLNRRAFLERACVGDNVKGLALFDIDHFKAVNDRFGHDVGDQVIVAFAALLARCLPSGALAGRMGGEEFAVLLPSATADAFAIDICHEVAALGWTPDGSPLTVSAGVASEMVRNEPEWRRIYIAADAALLDAKRGGRNRVARAKAALAA